MEFRSYNAELAVSNILFQQLFSNIQIERTDANNTKYLVPVTCVFGQRSRILKSLENPERKGNMKVPMIAINRTGYTRNGERLNDMHNEVKYELNSYTRKYQLMTPVPVDISYDVTIIAKYPSDIDKIASNFMVFFNSDIYVSCHHPKFPEIKMNNQVIMSDSVTEEHPDELDGSTNDLITASFQFTFKTFLFAGTTPIKITKPTIISSYTTTTLSNVVVELKPNQIDEFQKEHPNSSVSVYQPQVVTANVSVEVPNPDISTDIYEDIPVIQRIDFGIYPVPNRFDIEQYMLCVDNEGFVKHKHYPLSGYISSEQYVNVGPSTIYDPGDPDTPISAFVEPLSTINDYYDKVNNKCTFEPYVDRMYWKIDPTSIYRFPNNVVAYRD